MGRGRISATGPDVKRYPHKNNPPAATHFRGKAAGDRCEGALSRLIVARGILRGRILLVGFIAARRLARQPTLPLGTRLEAEITIELGILPEILVTADAIDNAKPNIVQLHPHRLSGSDFTTILQLQRIHYCQQLLERLNQRPELFQRITAELVIQCELFPA